MLLGVGGQARLGREGQGGASIRRIRPKTRSRTKIIKGCFSLFFRSYTPFCALSLTQILLETSYITFFCSRMQKTSYIAMRLFCVQQLKKLPTTTHRIVVYSCWSADPSHGKSFKSVQVSALFFRWHGAACPKNAFLCILVDKINVENMRKHRKHLLFQQGGVLLKCASNPRAEGGGRGNRSAIVPELPSGTTGCKMIIWTTLLSRARCFLRYLCSNPRHPLTSFAGWNFAYPTGWLS